MTKTYPYGPIDTLTQEDVRSASRGCKHLTAVLDKLGYSLGGTTLKRLRARFYVLGVTPPGRQVAVVKKRGEVAMGWVQQKVMNLGRKELEKFIAKSRNWVSLAGAINIPSNSNSYAILRKRFLQVGLEIPYKVRKVSQKKVQQLELPSSGEPQGAPIPLAAAAPNVRGVVPSKGVTPKKVKGETNGARSLRLAITHLDAKIAEGEAELFEFRHARGILNVMLELDYGKLS